jgi:hypothetical protein
MDGFPTPPSGESRLPAVRPPGAVARPGIPPAQEPREPGPPPRAPRDPHTWRRLTRTRRGAVGLGIVAAALLLWPFAGWFWIPWLAGLAVLVLIGLLRLDRLLGGWAWHVGGLAVVAGLMLRTGPWDWALAAALGVLLAGLVQLPWWRLAAVGAVLCVLAAVGWGVDRYRDAQAEAAQEAQRSQENFSLLGERTPERVLPALLEGIGQSDVVGVCGLLSPQAMTAFVQAAQASDCRGAVERLHAALPHVPQLRDLDAPLVRNGAAVTVNGCRTVWVSDALGGAALGMVDVSQSPPPGRTWFISEFHSCAGRSS